jgi:hypothetical protein
MAVAERMKGVLNVALTDDETTTEIIEYDRGAAANVYMPAAGTLTFYASDVNTGVFAALYRRTNADTNMTAFEAVTMTVAAAGWYPLPDECLPHKFVKAVLATGTAAAKVAYTS